MKGKNMTVKVPAPTTEFSEEEYQEFLAALKERASQHPTAPDTEIPSIKNSEHRQTIFNCLANNWSASRVHAYLMQTVNVDISAKDIQTFRDTLKEEDFLPVTYLQSKFKDLDIEIDAIGELARLLKLSAERLDTALFLENVTHPLHTLVDFHKREYWDLLRQYLAIQKGFGFFAVDTVGPAGMQDVLPANIPPGEIPTIRHLLELRVISEKAHNSEPIDADVKVLNE